jgi:transposase
MSEDLKCKKCNGLNYVKSGYACGKQRYKCKECGCQFTDTPKKGVHAALKSFAIFLYSVCGVSMLKIGKMLGVSDVSVLRWIRKEAENIAEPTPKSQSGIVMMDEMWHFINGKKQNLGLESH